MNLENLQERWKRYLDAFSPVDHVERERLLRQSVSADVVFTNPTGEGRGLEALIEHTAQFQSNSRARSSATTRSSPTTANFSRNGP